MTIAMGLVCEEGLVLCADSQETVPGYIKQYQHKVRPYLIIVNPTPPNPARTIAFQTLAFAGAGTSDYIQTAIQKASRDIKSIDNIATIEALLEERLLDFFDRHLSRFPEAERPTVDMLIGVTISDGEQALFHYCGTAFHRTESRAVGAGALLANNLINEFIQPGFHLTLEQLKSIGTFILKRSKQYVDTCGGWSSIVALHKNGDTFIADPSEVYVAESALEAIDRSMSALLRTRISETIVPTKIKMLHTKPGELSIVNVPDGTTVTRDGKVDFRK